VAGRVRLPEESPCVRDGFAAPLLLALTYTSPLRHRPLKVVLGSDRSPYQLLLRRQERDALEAANAANN